MPDLLSEKIFANALNLLPELGPVRLTKLRNYFGSWQKAWIADPSLYSEAGIPARIISQIIARKNSVNPEQSFAESARRQIDAILIDEPAYPQLLKEISAPPPILYVRGNKKALNSTVIAMVGTRKISLYGKQSAEELVAGLAANNLTIASGLAYGTDAEALSACLKNSGTAIAVLASDLDNLSISPRTNFRLAQEIMEKGCLVSEIPLGTPVTKSNFPVRNRIISGLSIATIVIEADLDSGSLITANYALEQNREVFAVPGSIFSPGSRGTNELIRRGAHIVTGISSILDELNLQNNLPVEVADLEATADEELILQNLSREPVHVEELIRKIRLAAATVNASLTILEMKGRVKHLGGSTYVKIR